MSHAARSPGDTDPDGVPGELEGLHRATRRIAEALTPAEVARQYHPLLSPIGWHLGHCALVERYWLRELCLGEPSDPGQHALYFPEFSAKDSRGQRVPERDALLTHVEREHAHHRALLADPPPALRDHPLMADSYLLHFLHQHHAQHLETIRFVLAQRAHREAPDPHAPATPAPAIPAPETAALPAGRVRVGWDDVRAYDNERPASEVDLAGGRIARHPVTNAEWLAFMADGGYRTNRWWSETGQAWREANAIAAPDAWRRAANGAWVEVTPDGVRPLDPDAPVMGVSWHEAAAFAAWADARLPHEHEWEAAARTGLLNGTGRVWEWCANALFPYPGFRAFPYEGYSVPWFDGRHMIARGGSAWTHDAVRRPSFRNFFEPEVRHAFTGLRLAW
ncbi:iron(II)-dependent oxidoreductase [Limimonas halophila]|uniref:Iron(II)-dependent oxidoreductase n=1 Tax=Limimonas halophila TaxID=1082479 RepID=A0A1G7TD76_9PROT|nr:SUMF1/EgtB/PvdO family nonheme iron enzyme [Limimonas halophila]SDG32609.1 iron(II)-dependent oxidoreductase [Limimonas halophila]